MKALFQLTILPLVLEHEGGFSNHPDDPGGPTNRGITLETYRNFYNPDATVEDLKNITHEQVTKIYREQYWDAIQGSALPPGLDCIMFDYAVKSGPGRAIKVLQRILRVKDDGIFGPKTWGALKENDPARLIEWIAEERMDFLQGLPHWPTFKRGWTRRVNEVEAVSLKLWRRYGERNGQKAPPPPDFVEMIDEIINQLQAMKEHLDG